MDIIELCASPSNDEFKSVVGELAKMQFETSLRVLQKRYALDDATSANHFNSLLKSVENRPMNNRFWCPEVGLLMNYCTQSSHQVGVNAKIAQSVLAYTAVGGFLGNYEVTFSELGNDSLYFAGKAIQLSEHQTLKVTAKKVEINGTDTRFIFNDAQGTWLESIEGEGTKYHVIDGIRLSDNQFSENWGQVIGNASDLSERQLTRFHQALEILQQHLPEYYEWVKTLLKEVTILERPETGALISGSTICRFGGVDICMDASPLEVAEMLIHESSHQMYNLLYTFGDIVEKGAPTVFSPLKDTQRPLHNTISGFHAFGNVLLAYEKIWLNSPQLLDVKRLQRVRHYLEGILSNLPEKLALTDLGNSIFFPLRMKVSNSLSILPS